MSPHPPNIEDLTELPARTARGVTPTKETQA